MHAFFSMPAIMSSGAPCASISKLLDRRLQPSRRCDEGCTCTLSLLSCAGGVAGQRGTILPLVSVLAAFSRMADTVEASSRTGKGDKGRWQAALGAPRGAIFWRQRSSIRTVSLGVSTLCLRCAYLSRFSDWRHCPGDTIILSMLWLADVRSIAADVYLVLLPGELSVETVDGVLGHSAR